VRQRCSVVPAGRTLYIVPCHLHLLQAGVTQYLWHVLCRVCCCQFCNCLGGQANMMLGHAWAPAGVEIVALLVLLQYRSTPDKDSYCVDPMC
jgi:hypothetical protein